MRMLGLRIWEAAPEPSAFPSEARGGPAFQRARVRPPPLDRSVAAIAGQEEQPSSFLTHGLLRKTPPSPGLADRLESVCEPWRRDRLPEEAMSEGARTRELSPRHDCD